jgi:uncharacterized membrane protein YccF (DUF307 family)
MIVFIGNLLWFVFGGGVIVSLLWIVTGVFFAMTIIGIPFAVAAFRIANFAACPFGRCLIDLRLIGETQVTGTGFINLLWIILAGIWLGIFHTVIGISLCWTVIGLPFGLAHLKLAQVSIAPLGKKAVSSRFAKVAEKRAIETQLNHTAKQRS